MNKMVAVVGGSTLVYACLAWLMGVLPGIELSKMPAGYGVKPLTTLQAEGRDVYVANGCSYCHTQQVRPLDEDKGFGRPSAAGDFAYQTPELLGSERTGPDLTSIGTRQPSSVWQYIHLYDPRAVVPASIMPSFNWMFDVVDKLPPGVTPVPLPKAYAPAHGMVVPTHKAEALVAYLASLKQAPLPSSEISQGGQAMDNMAGANKAKGVMASAGDEGVVGGADLAKGSTLFVANCSACHQANGEGLLGAFPSLKGNEAVNDPDATLQINVVLHGLHDTKVGGVLYASAMPPFGNTLSDTDITNIIDYERSSWGNHGKPINAAQVAAERAKAK